MISLWWLILQLHLTGFTATACGAALCVDTLIAAENTTPGCHWYQVVPWCGHWTGCRDGDVVLFRQGKLWCVTPFAWCEGDVLHPAPPDVCGG